MNIVLIGYRGCGKSAAGQLLAQRLNWPFVDTDAIIQARSGMTIREIFADQAERGFREVEAAVIAETARLDSHVISTGGGALLREENALALNTSGKFVWLTAPAEVIWKRILADSRRHTERPAIDFAQGLQQIRETLRNREPVYTRWADVTVSTSHRTVEAVVERTLVRLRLHHPPG